MQIPLNVSCFAFLRRGHSHSLQLHERAEHAFFETICSLMFLYSKFLQLNATLARCWVLKLP